MIDWGWVSRELTASKCDNEIKEMVVALLNELEIQRGKYQPTDSEERDALIKVQKLAAGHSIAVEEKQERWAPVIPGYYGVGDTIRVKPDAYEGDKGVRHNGKRGRVVAARDGMVLVVYADESADIQYRHHPNKLQVLR